MELSYSNTPELARSEPAAPAPAAAKLAGTPAEPKEARTFSYPATNQPKPEGLPADQEVIPLPENIRALRDSPERKMFSAQKIFESAIPVDASWPEENKLIGYELREAAADAGFSEPQVRGLNKIATGLGDSVTAEQLTQWRQEAEADLRREYGEDGAKQALEAAKSWLASQSPVLVWYLNSTGLGSHSAFVRAIVERAYRR